MVWELSLQSAPHESHSVRLASAALRPPPDSHTALPLVLTFLHIVTNTYTVLDAHTIPQIVRISLNSPHFLVPPHLTTTAGTFIVSVAWITIPLKFKPPSSNSFPPGRCAIWFQAPAQLLLKTVGKHPGIRRICGTNSCPVVSARRLFLPLSFLFFFNICQDISWASTLSYCSSYAIRVGTFKAGYPLKWSGVIGKVFKCIGLKNVLRHSSSLKVIVGVFLQKTSTKLLATHLELRAGFGLGFVYLDNLELKNYDARTNAWGLIWKISYYPSWKYACLALWGLTLNLLIF